MGDVHEHHLVARSKGGAGLPTVNLCIPCHALVHGRTWDVNHIALTKAGMDAAKARGVRLGNPNVRANTELAKAASRALAEARALEAAPIIREAQAAGAVTLRAIAAALNARGVPTPRGGRWAASQVANVLKRLVLKPCLL